MCEVVSTLNSPPYSKRHLCVCCYYHSLTPPLLHQLFLQWESKEGHWKKGEESAKKNEAEGGPWDKGFCNPWVVLGGRLRCRVCVIEGTWAGAEQLPTGM